MCQASDEGFDRVEKWWVEGEVIGEDHYKSERNICGDHKECAGPHHTSCKVMIALCR